jgi:hypothetical protein
MSDEQATSDADMKQRMAELMSGGQLFVEITAAMKSPHNREQGHIALSVLRRRLDQYRAIVERLPKTADGVSVVPGDKFYCLNYNNIVEAVVPRMCFGPEPIEGRVNGLYWKPERGYSTREAAEAALAATRKETP